MTKKLFNDLIWINNINPLNKHTNTRRQKQDNTKQLNERARDIVYQLNYNTCSWM